MGAAFEDLVDGLSWDVLDSPGPSTSGEQRNAKSTEVPKFYPKHDGDTVDHRLEDQAFSRILEWQKAVQRAQERQRHAAVNVSESGSARARGNSGTVSEVLPPACPQHVPASDPYWSQVDSYAVTSNGKKVFYNECRYSRGCTQQFTNLERINAMRRVLETTKNFLWGRQIEFVLYGGAAIGAFRCQDLLPWDVDTDVMVQRDQLNGLLHLLEGAPYGTGAGQDPNSRSVDMAELGFPGFQLMEKYPGCQPLIVVDKSTGFFTDLFPWKQWGNEILSPWWSAKRPCNAQKLFAPCHHRHCHSWSSDNTFPASAAKIHDSLFPVANKLRPWLIEQYGPSVAIPDVPTSTSASNTVAVNGSIPNETVTRVENIPGVREPEPEITKKDGSSSRRMRMRSAASPKAPSRRGGQAALLAGPGRETRPSRALGDRNESTISFPVRGKRKEAATSWLKNAGGPTVFFSVLAFFLGVPMVFWILKAPIAATVLSLQVGLYMAWSILTYATKDGHHNSAMLTLNALLVKLTISLGLWRNWEGASFAELPAQMWKMRRVLLSYAVPAGLYASSDILRVEALRATDPGTFTLLFNSRMLFLVLVWQYAMGRQLYAIHWCSLFAILAGCSAKAMPNANFADVSTHYWAYGQIVLLGLFSALAAVWNEFLLQRNLEAGVSLQNLGMYIWGLLIIFVITIVWAYLYPAEAVSPFDPAAWSAIWTEPLVAAQMLVLALYGVNTAFFLRHLNNIVLTVSMGCLVVLTTAMDFLLFGLELGAMEYLGIVLVLLGVALFGWRPVLKKPDDASKANDGASRTSGGLTPHP